MSADRQIALEKIDGKLRTGSAQHLYLLEAILYVGVGVLLSAAGVAALFEAGAILWRGMLNRTLANDGLLVLDQLLLVLMLVEILHTVRISVRSKELMLAEPFLIVGLIASIRRVLVITLQAAKLTEGNHGTAEGAIAFRNAMIELGLLGFLILVFVLSLYLLHRTSRREASLRE
jgi:hypothetical protein